MKIWKKFLSGFVINCIITINWIFLSWLRCKLNFFHFQLLNNLNIVEYFVQVPFCQDVSSNKHRVKTTFRISCHDLVKYFAQTFACDDWSKFSYHDSSKYYVIKNISVQIFGHEFNFSIVIWCNVMTRFRIDSIMSIYGQIFWTYV